MVFSKSSVEAILEEFTLPAMLRVLIAGRQALDLLLMRRAAEVAEDIDGIASLEPPLKLVPSCIPVALQGGAQGSEDAACRDTCLRPANLARSDAKMEFTIEVIKCFRGLTR